MRIKKIPTSGFLHKFILLLLLVFCGQKELQAQYSATSGKEFYVAFGRNHDNSPACRIRYVVTSTCRITTQYADGTYLDNNVEYLPGIYNKTIDLAKAYSSLISGSVNVALKISATQDIGVLAINVYANTTDGTTLLPNAALGKHYTIIDDTHGSYSAYMSAIATEDNTSVVIKNTSGATVSTQTLNKGQSYFYSLSTGVDLSGYTVSADKKIAVFAYNVCGKEASCGACDHLFEQMWPTDTAGKEFFLWNISNSNSGGTGATCGDLIKILALEDGTVITKKTGGTTSTISLDKNQTNLFKLLNNVMQDNSSAPATLSSNKPIIVANINGFAPALRWVNPIEQTITEAAISPFVVPGSVITKHYLNIMIPAGTESNTIVKENGIIVDNLKYFTNTTNPGYVLAERSYASEEVLVEITNPGGLMAYMGGYGASESYVVSAGAGAFNLQNYFTITTKTQPYNNTYYSATSTMTHSYEETDNVTIKRTIEKTFTSVKWFINNIPYTGITENTNVSNTFTFPASLLQARENTITMSVRYTGTDTDETYSGKIWLTGITDYPDNISDDLTCVREADKTIWGIGESLPINTTDLVHNYGPLTVGDIDGDTSIEIIGLMQDTRTTNNYESNGIKIFNYIDGKIKLKKSFSITANGGATTASFGAMAIARYNNQGYIVVAGTDKRLYAYSPDGTRLWKSDADFGTTIPGIVNIADFNGDGIPEVYIGNKIFSLANGYLLCDGGANNIGSLSATGASPMAIDIDNDKKLELCAGSQIYKVNIINTSGLAGNSMTPISDIELPATAIPALASKDGPTQLVDIDNDGMLEVIVTSLVSGRVVVYVWKPLPEKGSYLMGSYTVPITNISYYSIPMVGNIDNDVYPEIVFITNGGSGKNDWKMYALDFDHLASVGSMLKQKWTLGHSDGSGCTGMSLFDFNLDGTAEIVYRDETMLRIIDGSGATAIVKETFDNVKSGTLREYPIIADIDKDGQAEIIVAGWDGTTASGNTQNGFVRVFKSSGTQWAPARSVWNQYNYNSVNVNEDLTIPASQFPITTKFKGKDKTLGTSDDIRVYNNFRQQQTYLDKYGIAYMKLANAQILDADQIKFDYDNQIDILKVSGLYVHNAGDAMLKAPLAITVYKNVVSPSSTKYTFNYLTNIPIGNTDQIQFNIPNFGNWLPVDNLLIKVNDTGTGYNNQEVCDSCCVNNTSGSFANIPFETLAWADTYRKCIGDNVSFTAVILPGTNVSYKWETPSGINFANTRNTTLNNLSLSQGGEYIFKANNINGNLSVKYVLPYLSVAPLKMTWRKDVNSYDWNNLNNWLDGQDNPIKAVPSSCTDVHIPGGAATYPSLDDLSTPIDHYGSPVAKDLILHYGGQISYPHKLTYQKAHIQYNFGYYGGLAGPQPTKNAEGSGTPMLQRDRWYLLSAPLKNVVSGDFTFAGYPITWQSVCHITNPVNSHFETADLSKPYPRNDIPLTQTNNAFALKVAGQENIIGKNNHKHLEALQGILQLPYLEKSNYPGHQYDPLAQISRLFYFNTHTLQQLTSPVGEIKRGPETYRFLHEDPQNNNKPYNITVAGQTTIGYQHPVTTDGPNRKILVGNPFISSLNPWNLYQANQDILENNGYDIYDGQTQQWKNYSFTTTNNIAPLQAFVLTLKPDTPSGTLKYPLEGQYPLTRAGGISAQPLKQGNDLYIKTTLSGQTDNSAPYAVIQSTASTPLTKNVKKLITPQDHAIAEPFLVSPDGKTYNQSQPYHEGQTTITLGIKTSDTNQPHTLTFENIDNFIHQHNVYPVLEDRYLGIRQDITLYPRYTFTQRTVTGDNYYADADRFVLRFYDEPIATSQSEDITITYQQKELKITSTHAIKQVTLYTLLGQTIHHSGTLPAQSTYTYNRHLPLSQGVYIVKVQQTDGKIVTKKITSL